MSIFKRQKTHDDLHHELLPPSSSFLLIDDVIQEGNIDPFIDYCDSIEESEIVDKISIGKELLVLLTYPLHRFP